MTQIQYAKQLPKNYAGMLPTYHFAGLLPRPDFKQHSSGFQTASYRNFSFECALAKMFVKSHIYEAED